MEQPRTLIPDHITRLEDDGVVLASIVEDVQVPVLGHRLTNVQNGGHNMGFESDETLLSSLLKVMLPIDMGYKPRSIGISPDTIGCCVLKLQI